MRHLAAVLGVTLMLVGGTVSATETTAETTTGANSAPVAGQACRAEQVELRGDWGTARFSIEVADDDATRAQGLMNREHLAQSAGMLFVYPKAKPVSFWMKNTLIPLDMIFIDAAGVVQKVHSNATPHDTTPISGGDGVKAVLEINGGLARRMGIAKGTQIRHPVFADNAPAWPC
ncbi:DUF192 domain-containing protein [Rhodobacteraceae bacterium KMM 6894]|nr:DUF192 domain-containing protein [Rhodobacteraceae bacterium KMM 6894]